MQTEHENVLEGEHQVPQHRERLFSTVDALADFIVMAEVQNGQFSKLTDPATGKEIWGLLYQVDFAKL